MRAENAKLKLELLTTPGLGAPSIDAAYRELVRKWHPDRGGSVEGMQALVDFAERLKQEL